MTARIKNPTPAFPGARRALLDLRAAADHAGLVPDHVWAEAARHYPEDQLGALVIAIATINAFNRLQAVTGQVTGHWVEQVIDTDLG